MKVHRQCTANFDGRKYQTTLQEYEGSQYYRKVTVEEHIAVMSKPDSVYSGHFTAKSGTSMFVCDSIFFF